MAMSSSEAQKMVDTANKEGKMLSVVHNFKFMSEVRKARAMVKNGDIGDVERVNAVLMKREGQSKEYVQRAKSSGDIGIKYWDESPHMIYLVKSFMDDIELSAAEVCENQSNDGYKRIKARFSGNSLSEASISFLWDSPVTEWWIIVTGTEGILFIDIYRNIMVNLSRESEHTAKSVMYVLLDTCQQLLFGTAFSGVKYIKDRFVNGYKIPDAGFSHQIQRFVDAIERGHELPVTGVDGKAVLDHMIEIQEMSDISINN
ncbi:dehydrogenase [Haloferax larsenii JCM 13917]|nr:dehydrogenase [Haloferax larsenii JCM 13917]